MRPQNSRLSGSGSTSISSPSRFSVGLYFVFGVFSGTDVSLVVDATFPEAVEPEVEVASGAVSPPLEIELSVADTRPLSIT